MILQYSTAALVSEMKKVSNPSGVDSIPTSAGQEDYVSMGTISARYLRKIVDMGTSVVAAELMAATQGIYLSAEDLGKYAKLGEKTEVAYNFFLENVNNFPVLRDRVILNTIWEEFINIINENKLKEIF